MNSSDIDFREINFMNKIQNKISKFKHKKFWRNFLFKIKKLPNDKYIEDWFLFLNYMIGKKYKLEILNSAIETDNLEIANFILNTKFLPESSILLACKLGKISFLERFKKERFFGEVIKNCLYFSVKNNNLNVLIWFYNNGYITNKLLEKLTLFALSPFNFEIIKWVYSIGGSKPGRLCESAALSGKLEYFLWAINNGGVFEKQSVEYALQVEAIKILDWIKMSEYSDNLLFNNSYQKELCKRMAELGKFKSLIWLIQNGFDFEIDSCVDAATNILRYNFKNSLLQLKK